MNYKYMIFVSCCVGQNLPVFSKPACLVNRDILYVLGGTIDGVSQNQIIYSISLRNLTQGNSPTWVKNDSALNLEADSWFSGAISSQDAAFVTVTMPSKREFEIHELNFKTLSFTRKHIIEIPVNKSLLPQYNLVRGTTIIQSDKSQFVIHGGGIKRNNINSDMQFTFSYNSFSDSLTTLNYTSEYSLKNKFHSVAIYNGVMYIVGSYTEAGPSFELYGLDLKNKEWKAYKVSGDFPKKQCGFSYTQRGNLLYATGGETCRENPDFPSQKYLIYVLNLDSFSWSTYYIQDFKGYSQGCLIYYDNYLVHAFGQFNSDKVQVINTSKWGLVSINKTSSKSVASEVSGNSNLIALIVSLSACLLAVLIMLLIIRHVRRKEKIIKLPLHNSTYPIVPIVQAPLQAEPLAYPEYVMDPLWIQHRPKPYCFDLLSDTAYNIVNNEAKLFVLQCVPQFESILGNYEAYVNSHRQNN